MLWQHVPYSLRYSNSCLHGFIPWMFCVETHHCCWISPFLTEWFTDPDVQAQVDLVSWGSEADLPQQLGSSWPPVLRLVPQRNHKGWGWIVSFLRKDPLTPPTVSPALTRAAAPLQCVSPPPLMTRPQPPGSMWCHSRWLLRRRTRPLCKCSGDEDWWTH